MYGFEIGNEVDEYAYTGARWTGDWTSELFWSQWAAYAENITAALHLNDTRIFTGAVYTMHNATWDEGLISTIESGVYARYLRAISYHEYGSAVYCSHQNISLDFFLSDNTTDHMEDFRLNAAVVAAARTAGLEIWRGESNSIACGGQPGLSDTFASTLWVLDWAAGHAARNYTALTIHGGSGGAYTPCTYANQLDPSPKVRPVYYGMLAAAEFLSNGSVILSTDTLSSTVPNPGNDTTNASGPGLKVWASRDAAGVTRVFCIHRAYSSPNVSTIVSVSLTGQPQLAPQASLARLWAPEDGVGAKVGVVWAGQTFDGTTTGLPFGPRSEEPVPLAADGIHYEFEVFAGSAAMLIVPSAEAPSKSSP